MCSPRLPTICGAGLPDWMRGLGHGAGATPWPVSLRGDIAEAAALEIDHRLADFVMLPDWTPRRASSMPYSRPDTGCFHQCGRCWIFPADQYGAASRCRSGNIGKRLFEVCAQKVDVYCVEEASASD